MTSPPLAEPLRDILAGHLARFDRRSVPAGERRPAAVAVVVMPDGDGQAAVLLTLRASGLRRHGGQWALPGGRLDPEETPEAGARVLDIALNVSLHVLAFLQIPQIGLWNLSGQIRHSSAAGAGIRPTRSRCARRT
jgi:8-oxo-dGTP pyrophosphatase MutT (NUDIX family)